MSSRPNTKDKQLQDNRGTKSEVLTCWDEDKKAHTPCPNSKYHTMLKKPAEQYVVDYHLQQPRDKCNNLLYMLMKVGEVMI